MKTFILVSALVAAGWLVHPAPSASQTSEATEEQLTASAVRDLYKEAEAYRTGDAVEVDLDRAIGIYEKLAATGHKSSLQRLGKIYVDQGRGEDALNAYQEAARQNSSLARLQIAIGHSRGDFGSLSDPSLGVPQLVEIAEAEDSEKALYALAEAYRKGQGTDQNPARAFEIYRSLAERGYVRAYRRLGDFYRRGIGTTRDIPLAITAYNAAIEGGKDLALMGLSKAQIEAGQLSSALQTLNLAVERGVKGAELALAIGHFERTFGSDSQRALGGRELGRLAEQGDIDAGRAVLRYHEQRWTRIRPLDLDAVLTNLTNASAAGDGRATESLARFYREMDWLVPNAKAKHAGLVDAFGDQMKPSKYILEKLYAMYDPKAPRSSQAKMADFVQGATNKKFISGMRALRSINRNAYTNLLQRELKAGGFYNGPITGMMSEKTLRAALSFCSEIGASDACRNGPLTSDAADLMIQGFSDRRM